MPSDKAKIEWEKYRAQELEALTPLLAELGFELEPIQPHTEGERYLMQAVTTASGKKLVLMGKRSKDGKRVVIKASSNASGIREIDSAKKTRGVLHKINFAYEVFRSPEELLYTKKNGFAISIQEFIEQERTFISRPLEEQFALALSAFKAQEGAHATTRGHEKLVKRTFDSAVAVHYISAFKEFKKNIFLNKPSENLCDALKASELLLTDNAETIEQYCGFLTHTDFVPHNFRTVGSDIYLLDHSSLRFGNKYEGWARFLNFMTLYNPPLEQALVEYVRLNRTPEESLSLKLMRIYRLAEIIWYYTERLGRTSGDLHTLDAARVAFWTEVLKSVLEDKPLATDILENYRHTRDSLRSPEEKLRQRDLH